MTLSLAEQLSSLKSGDHLALVYETFEEQIAVVAPYFKAGLANGQRCVYVADEHTPEQILAALATKGIDAERERARGALLMLTKEDTYLGPGYFDPAEMVGSFRQSIDDALAAGFSGLRATSEMTWALGPEEGNDRLLEYEALLNHHVWTPESRAIGICQYNLHRFPPDIIGGMLETQPMAILGDQLCPNMYYQPPGMPRRGDRGAARLEWMISQLRSAWAAAVSLEEVNTLLEARVAERTSALQTELEQHRKTQAELTRQNRIYRFLSQINQTIFRVRDRGKLLQAACRVAVESGAFRMAWVGMVSEDRRQVVPEAYYGVKDGHLEAIFISTDSEPAGLGPTGVAVRTGHHSVANDIQNDERMLPLRDGLRRRGYRSSAAFPLRLGPRIVGVFTVQSDEAGFFDDAEVSVLDEMANDLSFALEALDSEAQRARAIEELRENEERFQMLYEKAPAGQMSMDANGRLLQVNDALLQVTGYPRDEVLGHWAGEFLTSRSVELFRERFPMTLKAGFTRNAEYELIRKNGEEVAVSLDGRVTREPDGSVREVQYVLVDITERKRAESKLQESAVKLRRAMEQTVQALAAAAEVRDPYTAGHQRRVSKIAATIAEGMGLPEDEVDGIRLAGAIHDIGKIAVPTEILSKPGRISALETELIREHPGTGYDMLNEVEFPWPIAGIVLQHHERMDGSGYPSGLAGSEILLGARVLAVADVLEAMASDRPYRAALGLDEAMEEISRNRGTLFDAEVVDAFLLTFEVWSPFVREDAGGLNAA